MCKFFIFFIFALLHKFLITFIVYMKDTRMCKYVFFKINIKLLVKLNIDNMQNYFIEPDDSDFSSENLSVTVNLNGTI